MTNNERDGRKKPQRYSKALKSEVCKVAAEGKQSYKELGAKFDIEPKLISSWMRSHREDGTDAFRGRGNRGELEAEVIRLRKENHDLRQEQDFLKKAAAYFAKSQK